MDQDGSPPYHTRGDSRKWCNAWDAFSERLLNLHLKWSTTFSLISSSATVIEIAKNNPMRLYLGIYNQQADLDPNWAINFSQSGANYSGLITPVNNPTRWWIGIDSTNLSRGTGIPLCDSNDYREFYQSKDGPLCTLQWFGISHGVQKLLVVETVYSGYPGRI